MWHAWWKGTVKLYTNYLRKWGLYCLLHQVKPLKPSIAQILRFLRLLEDEVLGFGSINAAKCALSIILPRIDGETRQTPADPLVSEVGLRKKSSQTQI